MFSLPFFHAYGIAAPASALDAIKEKIYALVPDIRIISYTNESFLVEHARQLRELHMSKSATERCVLVCADSMSREAQNALLKTLEEPAWRVIFMFVLPHTATLLPTLRSRLCLLSYKQESVSAEHFLALTPAQRLKEIATLLEKHKKGKIHRIELENLARSLVSVAPRHSLVSVADAVKHVHHHGASLKAILEYIAVTV